jgi:lipoate-protein ligase A
LPWNEATDKRTIEIVTEIPQASLDLNDRIASLVMKLVDKTFAEAAENIAFDEALLLAAERSGDEGGFLRIWEPAEWLVVVGRGSSLLAEVDLERCRQDRIPVIRRSSGGAAIVAGPGCLFYAVVLSLKQYPSLRFIDRAHAFVLSKLAEGLRDVVPGIERQGTSDLAVEGKKVSGNSLRCRKDHLLYHGTLLYNMPLEPLAHYLRFPPRQPDYRDSRCHADFVTNLKLSRKVVHQALLSAWDHPDSFTTWSQSEMESLVREKYSKLSWTAQIP